MVEGACYPLCMLKFLSLLTISVGLFAQTATTPIPLRNTGCYSATEKLVVMTIPVSVSAVTVPVPICVALGTGLRLNTSTSQARLEIDPAALPPSSTPAAVPRLAIKVVNLASLGLPNTPGAKQAGIPLEFTPAPGSFLLITFQSSRVGNDIVDFVPFAGGDQPKIVQVLLPAYQPYESTDVLKILYWTLEPPPA